MCVRKMTKKAMSSQRGYIGDTEGVYRDNGKENGNYHLELRVTIFVYEF